MSITNNNNYLAFSPEKWDKMTLGITGGDYVLVLGGDMILKDSGCRHSSVAFFERLRKERRRDDDEFADLGRREQMLRMVEEHEFRTDDVSEKLRSLLSTKCFRTVMTTTGDHYVEEVMREIWGDSLVVLDIYGDSSKEFDLEGNVVSDEFYETKPVLYYVFGKVAPSNRNKKFTVTENDYLEAISRWLNVETRPNKLCEFLSRKQILAVGCKYENWYFRFFWYALRGNIHLPLRGKRNSVAGEVALTLNFKDDDGPDTRLGNYLKNEGVYTYPDSEEFIDKLAESLDRVKDNFERMRSKGGVFISYASEDSSIAAVIFNHLVSAGYNVWFDSARLFGGDSYDIRIETAISDCKLFLPILSGQTIKDLTEGNERYYIKEWKFASTFAGSMNVLPVALDGYDPHSPAHQKVEDIVGKHTSYEFGSSPINTLCELVGKSL